MTSIRITPRTLPPMEGSAAGGWDGRCRVYTNDHLPFDALPQHCDGGPATVALGDWGVSYPHLCEALSSPSVVAASDGMVTLNIYRVPRAGGSMLERHPLDGTKYPTQREATRAAYEAGCVGFMVYERDAPRFGLPTVGGSAVDERVTYLGTGIGNLKAAKRYLRNKFRQQPAQPVQARNGRWFYVTIRSGRRGGFLLGPYVSHMTALAQVERGRRLAQEANPGECEFASFGTCSLPARRKTVFGR